VKRWLDDEQRGNNFTMSPDRFHRYRQTGTYGAYRVAFRTIRGLTTGDGWTPADTALKLAKLVDASLPRDARLKDEQFESGTKWASWKGEEARYWIERGWPSWQTPGGWLPTPRGATLKRLPDEERGLLEQAIFGEESVRRIAAKVLANAKSAESHADLCEALANSSVLSKKIEPASLAPLPAFSRLADAGMDAMRELWDEINHDESKQAPTIEKLARSAELQSKFDGLRESAEGWLSTPVRKHFPDKYEDVVTRLANAMRDAPTLIEQIRALARHHHEHGGGRRWFQEQNGKLVCLIPYTGIAASDYSFRLRSLCRLAAQCGVANMNHALDALAAGRQETDEEEGDIL
jgi:hypothetical protein